MTNYKKIIFLFLILFFSLIYFGYKFTSSLGYKLGGTLGKSNSIEESIERGVFIKKLDYKLIPSIIEFKKERFFFIEKSFRYGEKSIRETILSNKKDDFTYQIVMTPKEGEIFKGDFLIGENSDSMSFNNLVDTIKLDIIKQKINLNRTHKVGELLLFDKR
jgi:hypothetical protein